QQRAAQDDEHDETACQVLDPTISVGEPPRGPEARQGKGNPERNGRRRVCKIVDRIRQERHAAREQDDDDLEQRRGRQPDERPREHSETPAGRYVGWVDDAVYVTVMVGIVMRLRGRRTSLTVGVVMMMLHAGSWLRSRSIP